MGVGVSLPIDSAVEDKMKAIIGETLKIFSEKYAKAYPAVLLKSVEDDARKAEKSEYELLERPSSEASKDPAKTGWLSKEGAVVKNWKKRFFVVRPDYKIDYFDKEETAKSGGNPKGTINPSGYAVAEDADSALAKRIEELAKKLEVEVGAFGKKSLPPHTAGLLKKRRRDWFLQFDSEEAKLDWLPTLRLCAKKASAFSNPDPISNAAFTQAFAATAWARGFSPARYNGSESEQLSDLIVDQLERDVLDEVFGALKEKISVAKLRVMAIDKLETVVGGTVNAAVSAAWSAASAATDKARPPVESKLKANVDKIVAAQDKISEKAREKVSGHADPVIARVAAPLAEKAIPAILPPIVSALKEVISLFKKDGDSAVKELSGGQNEAQVWRNLARAASSVSTFKGVIDGLKQFDALIHLGDKLPLPEGVKCGVEEVADLADSSLSIIMKLLDNAFYTLQKLFTDKQGEDKAGAAAAAFTETVARLEHDCAVHTAAILCTLLGSFCLGKVKADVVEPGKEAIAPVAEEIPDFLKDVVDLDDVLEKTVEEIYEDAVSAIVKPSVPSFA
eukprot:m.220976 g.220976  ORF g.220976 m.220976 type:complete len:564 (-) comp10487_c0_seq1:63-1754(-)